MDIQVVFWKVLGFLGKGIFIVLAYYFGWHFSSIYKSKIKSYLLVLACTAVVSLGMWASYGTYREKVDPLFGGGKKIEVFKPTDKERNEHGLTIFISLTIPTFYGVYKRKKSL